MQQSAAPGGGEEPPAMTTFLPPARTVALHNATLADLPPSVAPPGYRR